MKVDVFPSSELSRVGRGMRSFFRACVCRELGSK